MNSKSLIFAVLLCALVLFVSSSLAAEATPKEEANEENVKEPDQYGGGGGCRYGCCGWVYGRCRRCCKTEAEAAGESVGTNGYGGGGGKGGGGGWGGGGGGGHCRYGCCGGYGKYCRCCYNPEEAQMVQFGN